MALLKHAEITPSRRRVREYRQRRFDPQSLQDMFETLEIACVELSIPEKDWQQIEQIILAHERSHQHPAVRQAWEQYLVTRELVHVPHSHRIK